MPHFAQPSEAPPAGWAKKRQAAWKHPNGLDILHEITGRGLFADKSTVSISGRRRTVEKAFSVGILISVHCITNDGFVFFNEVTGKNGVHSVVNGAYWRARILSQCFLQNLEASSGGAGGGSVGGGCTLSGGAGSGGTCGAGDGSAVGASVRPSEAVLIGLDDITRAAAGLAGVSPRELMLNLFGTSDNPAQQTRHLMRQPAS
jgi:hypothetical protein